MSWDPGLDLSMALALQLELSARRPSRGDLAVRVVWDALDVAVAGYRLALAAGDYPARRTALFLDLRYAVQRLVDDMPENLSAA